MLGLITDRSQENVDVLRSLSAKGWANMTSYERAVWSGDPFTASDMAWREAVNLLPTQVHSSDNVSVIFRNEYFVATGAGTATVLIGDADSFLGADVTLSAETVVGAGGKLELIWYNSEDDYAIVASLTAKGSVSVSLDATSGVWDYLALHIYSQETVYYDRVMLNRDKAKQDYVPYTAILATDATKGAYNYSDLNRVEMVVAELSEKLDLGLTTKTDWSMWDVPTVSDMTRYRSNLVAIESHLELGNTMSDIPEYLSQFTFDHANMIEKFLLAVEV